jgi:hypothetical protein
MTPVVVTSATPVASPGPDRAVAPGRRVPSGGGRGDRDHRHHGGLVGGGQNGPDGRPLLHGHEDVVAAGQAERVGVGAQRPKGRDTVVLLSDVAALEIFHDGVAQPGPARRLGDGELSTLAGQPERPGDVRHGRRRQVRATLNGAVVATKHHGVPSVDKQTPLIVLTKG